MSEFYPMPSFPTPAVADLQISVCWQISVCRCEALTFAMGPLKRNLDIGRVVANVRGT